MKKSNGIRQDIEANEMRIADEMIQVEEEDLPIDVMTVEETGTVLKRGDGMMTQETQGMTEEIMTDVDEVIQETDHPTTIAIMTETIDEETSDESTTTKRRTMVTMSGENVM